MTDIKKKLTIKQSGDTTTAVLKIDGEVVKQAQVTRFHGDTDDFLTAAEYAIKKLRGDSHVTKKEYDVGDVVRVHDSDQGIRTGKIVKRYEDYITYRYTVLLSTGEQFLCAENEGKAHNAPVNDYIIGLVEELKAPATPDQADPRNLKAGDKVLVRNDLVAWQAYGYTFVENMMKFAGKIITLKRRYRLGWFVNEDNNYCYTPEMFAGKIVPCGELNAGDEVLVKDADDLCCAAQRQFANKIMSIDAGSVEDFGRNGCFVGLGGVGFKSTRFVGKLIRFKQEGK
jgi:hypothetical protein